MSARAGDRTSYQMILRAVGAYLDEYGASRVTILEAPEGFAVRYTRAADGSVHLVVLQHSDLLDRARILTRRRGRGPMRIHVSRTLSQGTALFEVVYQDLLRAIGWELDDSHAHNVLVDQIEAAFVVSYLTVKDGEREVWEKRSAKLGIAELETVAKEAHSRRQPPPIARRKLGQNVKLPG